MVLGSGILPYAYEGDTPLRSHRQVPIGVSGIFIEQAMWVLNAERRRYGGNRETQGDFTWDRYLWDGTTEGFEPTSSGVFLANPSNPAILVPINYILDLREAFFNHLIEDDVIKDCDYLAEEIRRDWLHNAYPNSPSGFVESDETNGDGNYFRGDPPQTGQQLSTDIGILGTSGVFFDIDLGEVMFNPYPRMGRSMYTSAHELRLKGVNYSTFAIVGSPIFPAFQDTEGNVVSSTSRDIHHLSENIGIFIFGPSTDGLYDTEHVQSGVVRIDGDMLASGCQFLLGDGGVNAKEDFQTVAEFTFAASGLRQLGVDPDDPTGDKGANSRYARVFVTPPGTALDPVPCGIYHIAATTPRSVFPNAVVESGIISHWPSGNPDFIAPGYQVFDDCFWVTDCGGAGLTGGARPSGLSVLSPFTHNSLWVRHAELTKTSAGSVPGAPFDNWPGFYGCTRAAADTIVRVRELREAGAPNGIFHFITYDDNLNFVSDSSLDSGVTTGQEHVDIEYDGTSYWVTARPTSPDSVWEVAGGFGSLQEYRPGLGTTLDPGRIAYLPSATVSGTSYWFFGRLRSDATSPTLSAVLFSTTPSAGTGTAGTWVSAVNLDIVTTGFTEIGSIIFVWDVIEVSGMTHVSDGIWALFTGDDGSKKTVWLAKIYHNSTAPANFTILELYPTALKDFTSGVFAADSIWYDLIGMPIFSS